MTISTIMIMIIFSIITLFFCRRTSPRVSRKPTKPGQAADAKASAALRSEAGAVAMGRGTASVN